MSDRDERLHRIREKHSLDVWHSSCQTETWLLSEVDRLERDLALAEAVVEAIRPMLHWEAIACRTYPASACSRYGGCPQCRLRNAVAVRDAGGRK